MMRRSLVALSIGCAMAVVSSRSSAQGTLGAQGFCYPPGQLSAFSRSLGGATGETDALSPINPAALALMRRGGLYLQSEQENRSLESGGQTGSTQVYRFPLFIAAVPIGSRGVLGASYSTLLDRTWGTEIRGSTSFEGDTVSFTQSFRSEGALNDVRFAGSWALRDNLIIGAAVHLFPGENRLTMSREFDDSLTFAPLRDTSTVNYWGSGFSAGVLWRPIRTVTVGASGRIGGKLDLKEADTLKARANAPSRFGAGVRWDVPGLTAAFRVDRTLWSDMEGLGSEGAKPEDAWDLGFGVDAVGPQIFGMRVTIRGGARRRTLPFLADSQQVHETAFSLGSGAPFARGRAQVDFFVERASRTASDIDATERSWTFGLGFTIRP
jgi:hypothetical protein